MSGNCVAKIPHEACGSSDALQVYEDEGKISGYCWKCHTYVADPLGEGKTIADLPKAKLTKTPEEIQEEIEFIHTLKACDLPKRRLRGDVLDDFGVKIGYSRKDGKTPEVQYFPYRKGGEVVRYKAKLLTHKAFWNIGRETEVDLFGWDEAIASGARRLIITEGECFLPRTEVLTRKGWVKLEDYDGVSEVYMPLANHGGVFSKPKAIVDKVFTGGMIEYSSGSYYSLTTPLHNLVRIDKEGNWIKLPANTPNYKHLKVPRTTLSMFHNTSHKDELLARAKVMVSADFTIREGGDLYAAFKKQRKIDRCKDILDELGVRYSSAIQADGYTNFFVHRGHGLDVGKLFNFKDLDTSLSKTMLEELVHWDGNIVPNRAQFEYSSKEYHNASFVQALAHTNGYTSTIIKCTNKWGSWYKVSILLKKTTSSVQLGYKEVPYSGRVMCLTMDSGMLLVRQNGSVSVSGNCDAVAGKRIVDMHSKKEFEDNKPAFVSLINGSKSAGKDLARLAAKIRKHFKEEFVSFCFDDDEAGELALEEACKIFPKAKSISLPLKDANECLIKGKSKAAFNAIMFKAKKPKNTRLVWGRDVHEKAKVAAEWGLSTPWPTLTDLTRGFRFGETWYIAAGEKMG